MKVSEIMTRDVEVVNANDSIQKAAQLMARIDAGALPVVENDRLVGMVTDRDITVRAVAEGRDPVNTQVGDVMTRDIKFCYEDEDIDEVEERMAEEQIRRLPVVSRDQRLVGIISLGDIARARSPREAGEALKGISQPGGEHSQSH